MKNLRIKDISDSYIVAGEVNLSVSGKLPIAELGKGFRMGIVKGNRLRFIPLSSHHTSGRAGGMVTHYAPLFLANYDQIALYYSGN